MGQRKRESKMPGSKLYALSTPFLRRTAGWRKFRIQRLCIPNV